MWYTRLGSTRQHSSDSLSTAMRASYLMYAHEIRMVADHTTKHALFTISCVMLAWPLILTLHSLTTRGSACLHRSQAQFSCAFDGCA